MTFDVQRKLTELNKRVFDLEHQLGGFPPAKTILQILSAPPGIPWKPPLGVPHELGGPMHTGVGDGLERDGTDLRIDEDAAFTWTALHTFNHGIAFDGEAGLNAITVPDNLAQGVCITDTGELEYLRIVSTNIQPVILFNVGNADIDFRVGAVGQANALFVEGSTGNMGGKTNTPAADFHIVGGTVGNKHYGNYRTLILEEGNVALQLIGEDASTGMVHIVLTGAPTSGDNKHWVISHQGPVYDNRFSVGYRTSSASDFVVHSVTEHFVILTGGNAGFGVTDPAEKVEVAGYVYAHTGLKVARSETGGWARGVHVYADADLTTELAGIGAYGSAGAAPLRLYMTMGDNPYSSTLGLVVDSAGRVALGTLTPATSALLELSSTTKTLLLSRMTTAQRDALTAVNGMIVYNTDTGHVEAREVGSWVDL